MSDTEDETVPLLPSLDEEFDDDGDVKSPRIASEGRPSNNSTVKVAIFTAVVLVAAVVLIGAIVGMTVAIVEYKHGKANGKVTSSASLPVYSSSKHSSNSTRSSHAPSQATTVMTLHTTSIATTTVSSFSYTTQSSYRLSSSLRPSLRSSSTTGTVLKPTPTRSKSSSTTFSTSVSLSLVVTPSTTPKQSL